MSLFNRDAMSRFARDTLSLVKRDETVNQEEIEASSTSTFVSALVAALITMGIFSGIWLVFHGIKRYRSVFQPRTMLAAEDKRPDPLPNAVIPFWRKVFSLDDTEVLRVNGLDSYFALRFMKVFGLYTLFPFFLITFAACIPATVVKPNNGNTGLKMFEFGNVPDASPQGYRQIVHFVVAFTLMSITLYTIWREYNFLVEKRIQWLQSSRHSLKSRTVAVINVPEELNTESGIRELASSVATTAPPLHSQANVGEGSVPQASPGGITHVWITRKVKPVIKVWEKRDKEVNRLESGVAKLQKKALKNNRKGKTPEQEGSWQGDAPMDRYVAPKKQPTWKQGFLGLIGQKMTLATSPVFIREQNEELATLRAKDDYESGNVSFARFTTQEEAHNFARYVSKSNKNVKMLRTSIEVEPEDIVWSNTSMNPYQRHARTFVSWCLTIGLIIVWGIIVAGVGTISNVDTLCTYKPFAWVCQIPEPAIGIIKGLLPSILITVLFMLLPMVLRLWIKLQGVIRKSDIELRLFTRYWDFWIIHGFLIMTISGGLVSALGGLSPDTFAEIPTMLANKLPGASLYFLTFVMVNNWAGMVKTFARVVPFIMYELRLKGILAGGTPRAVFGKKFDMGSFLWSEVLPQICLTFTITTVYSVVQPIITIIGLVAFVLTYASYKYLLVWTANQPGELETGGLYYIKCLRTVFVTLYIEGIFLAALFILKRTPTGYACGGIIAGLTGITALLQIYIDWFRFKKDNIIFGPSGMVHGITSRDHLNEKQDKAADIAEAGGVEAEDNLYYHPALWQKQPCVWIAQDPLEVGQYESDRINQQGVESSTEFAHMDEKGTIDVDRSPPDEDWEGGA